MLQNYSCDVCPACGEGIANRGEILFSGRRSWREDVADALGYDRDFIIGLGLKTRIHKRHFADEDIINNKVIGLPKFYIQNILHWPRSEVRRDFVPEIKIENEENEYAKTFDEFAENFEYDENAENGENDDDFDEINKKSDTKCVLVELEQLRLVLNHCYQCGQKCSKDSYMFNVRVGVTYWKYWCVRCNMKRSWRSYKLPLTPLVSSTNMSSDDDNFLQVSKAHNDFNFFDELDEISKKFTLSDFEDSENY